MKLLEITNLFESRIDHIVNSRGDRVTKKAKQEGHDGTPNQILQLLSKADPTPNARNIQWLTNQWLAGHFRLEDVSRVKNELKQFFQVQKKLEKRDLNQYSYHDMAKTVDDIFNNLKSDVEHTDISHLNAKVVYNGPLGLLVIPKDKEAAQALGTGTKWCTSAKDENMFDNYNKSGPIYIWKDKSGDKFQFWIDEVAIAESHGLSDHLEHPSDGNPFHQFMDARDIPLTSEQIEQFRKHPVVSKVIHHAESLLVTTALSALSYALDGLKGRWPEGEDAIASNGSTSLWYAEEVLHGPFPKGEDAIARIPHSAVEYARFIIKGRFPKGEPFIAKEAEFALHYAQEVIKGRWPEGENAIKEFPGDAAEYAIEVLKQRWPEAEPEIMKDEYQASQYKKHFGIE